MPADRRRVLWSAHADNDLLDIWSYLAKEASERVADERIRDILRSGEMLADWPHLGVPVMIFDRVSGHSPLRLM